MADRHLSVSLHQAAPIPLDVDFSCGAGDVLAIFGPSGSGKTTILRSIAGLYRPAQTVVRSGEDTWSDSESGVFQPPHRRRVGFVFQEYALFPHLTAAGNVITALGHLPRPQRRARAEQLLSQVHLSRQANRRPAELSGGERQRVAVARALAREPSVLLMDEPFAAVDRAVRRRLHDEIEALRRTVDVPLVIVTHDFDDVVRLATHMLVLEDGRGVASGALDTLMSRPDLHWIRTAAGLGSVFDAVVTRSHPSRALVELAFDGGTLLASDRALTVGTAVRLRIPAREVILATQPPEGISLHNVLAGTVTAVHTDPGFEHTIVQLAVGTLLLLAEITADAVTRLGIAPGVQLYALVKSVSIDVVRGQPDTPD